MVPARIHWRARGLGYGAGLPDYGYPRSRRRSPHPSVIPGYTPNMKTAISVPDDTFDRASARARDLGISRSEFFATAARHYLDQLDAESLTGQIDAALEHLESSDDSAQHAVSAGQHTLAGIDNEW